MISSYKSSPGCLKSVDEVEDNLKRLRKEVKRLEGAQSDRAYILAYAKHIAVLIRIFLAISFFLVALELRHVKNSALEVDYQLAFAVTISGFLFWFVLCDPASRLSLFWLVNKGLYGHSCFNFGKATQTNENMKTSGAFLENFHDDEHSPWIRKSIDFAVPVAVPEEIDNHFADSASSQYRVSISNDLVSGTRDLPSIPDYDESVPSTVDNWIIRTEAELEAVKDLRERLREDFAHLCKKRPLNLSDATLICFIRARNDLEESEKLFRRAYTFHKEWNSENIYKSFVPEGIIQKYIPGGWIGFDFEGHPVFLDRIGQIDASIAKHISESEWIPLMVRRHAINTRLFRESELRFGKAQNQITLIQDLKGLSLSHMRPKCTALLRQIAQINDDFFPEMLNLAIIINAPSVFPMIWRVVKWFFHENTREKIQIYNNVPTDILLQHVSPDILPKYWGGNRVVDGDSECHRIVGRAGKIAEEDIV